MHSGLEPHVIKRNRRVEGRHFPHVHSEKSDDQHLDTHICSRNPSTLGPSDIAQSCFLGAKIFVALTPCRPNLLLVSFECLNTVHTCPSTNWTACVFPASCDQEPRTNRPCWSGAYRSIWRLIPKRQRSLTWLPSATVLVRRSWRVREGSSNRSISSKQP
jgi:hypothetical protein